LGKKEIVLIKFKKELPTMEEKGTSYYFCKFMFTVPSDNPIPSMRTYICIVKR